MSCNVLILSHTYLDSENQKNLLFLSRYLGVHVTLPNRAPSLLFGGFPYIPHPDASLLVSAYPALRVSRGQYVLLTVRLGRRGFSPDVILIDYNPWSIMFAQALLYKYAFSPRARLVCFVKKNTYLKSRAPWNRVRVWIEDSCVARVHHFIAGSVMAANMLRRRFTLDGAKVSVGHHLGVDTDVFSPSLVRPERAGHSEREPVIVGYCGRFDDDKGVLELVESVRQARIRTGKTIELALLGRGSLSSTLAKMSSTERWITLHQPVSSSNVVHFLRRLDIFVLASKALPDHEEHDAHALLEALACGLPCIATDVGINADILDRGNGILVPRANADALVEAIALLVVNAEERRRLGRNAREVAIREFSLDAVAKSKASILERVARR